MPQLYVICGCNGAGKTTSSYTVLPEILQCSEFVNSDEIARSISPRNPAAAAIVAGRYMLQRMEKLIEGRADFAFETTLSVRSYMKWIQRAKAVGYTVTLVYFWLSDPAIAVQRVAKRVEAGGHHIPEKVIVRRYLTGIKYLFSLYLPLCDYYLLIDNSQAPSELIAEGCAGRLVNVPKPLAYQKLLDYAAQEIDESLDEQ